MRIIAGEARGRKIEAPAGRNTRPTLDRVRENLFNMIQNEVGGRRVLDLFSGSGALSLEALSRGAAFAVLVDRDRNAALAEENNIRLLRWEDRTRQIRADWEQAVRTLISEGERFDLVFLDPPYATGALPAVFEKILPLLEPDALVIFEHEAFKPVPAFEGYTLWKERGWGFCAVSIFKPAGGREAV